MLFLTCTSSVQLENEEHDVVSFNKYRFLILQYMVNDFIFSLRMLVAHNGLFVVIISISELMHLGCFLSPRHKKTFIYPPIICSF